MNCEHWFLTYRGFGFGAITENSATVKSENCEQSDLYLTAEIVSVRITVYPQLTVV